MQIASIVKIILTSVLLYKGALGRVEKGTQEVSGKAASEVEMILELYITYL